MTFIFYTDNTLNPLGNPDRPSLSITEFKNPVSSKVSACLEKTCDVAYFCGSEFILKEDLKVVLWYKDDNDNVPICYCSDIRRNEIERAVKNGCRSIDDVQDYLGKNITGKCKKENPLGLCCRNVFINEIEIQVKLIERKHS